VITLKDICILAEGGGIMSAYNAGVIKALREKYGLDEVKNIVAVSGAAATFIYFVSKQYDVIEKIWIDLIKSQRFIHFSNIIIRESILDIDFLVDFMIKKIYPLDTNELKKSKTLIYVPVTRASDGKTAYFSNKDDIDTFELIRAACAIPFFYKRKVKLEDDCYVDGAASDFLGLKKALELKPKNLLVILTQPAGRIPRHYFFRGIYDLLLKRHVTTALRKKIWNALNDYELQRAQIKELKKSMNLVIIQPKIRLPSHNLDSKPDNLLETIQHGYDDVMNHLELEEFFRKI
jgi:predicted patatin/cPLA2 family phospholipase